MEIFNCDELAAWGCGDFKLAPLPALIQGHIRSTTAAECLDGSSIVAMHDEASIGEPSPIHYQIRMMWNSVLRKMNPTEQMIAEQTAANITTALADAGLTQDDSRKPKRRM